MKNIIDKQTGHIGKIDTLCLSKVGVKLDNYGYVTLSILAAIRDIYPNDLIIKYYRTDSKNFRHEHQTSIINGPYYDKNSWIDIVENLPYDIQ